MTAKSMVYNRKAKKRDGSKYIEINDSSMLELNSLPYLNKIITYYVINKQPNKSKKSN